MSRKHTIEFIREQFEKEGYKLTSEKYENAHSKLNYTCPDGHKGSITWHSWRKGCRCGECSGNKRFTYEFVKKEFEKEGYILLTKEYKNNRQELRYICPIGHFGKIRFYKWRIGHRCSKCGGTHKYTIEDVKKYVKRVTLNYECLSNEYINNYTKLKIKCGNGHIYYVSFKDFVRGSRCPKCRAISNCGAGNPNWKGGISCEPYCDVWLDKEFKENIKQRDGYKCMNPDCWKTTKNLCIHHINYDKKDCRPENLVTVCVSCNSRANKNRDFWENKYKKIVHMKTQEAQNR